MKKYVVLSLLSFFAVTSCIFQEEIVRTCKPHDHPYPVEEAEAPTDKYLVD